MIDRYALSGLREQWKIVPGTVSQAIGLEMVDTIEALMVERDALEALLEQIRSKTPDELFYMTAQTLKACEKERDQLKARVETLREALKVIAQGIYYHSPGPCSFCQRSPKS